MDINKSKITKVNYPVPLWAKNVLRRCDRTIELYRDIGC